MNILTLSGWGQPYDALSSLLPEARHFDYTKYDTIEEASDALTDTQGGYDTVVGWSLGGQLAAHAVASGKLSPKKLVLVAAPYQFVESPALKLGMGRETFDKFRANYARDPLRTISKGWELIVKNDAREEAIRGYLDRFDKNHEVTRNWERWLQLLENFSNQDMRFAAFPQTTIIHGGRDAVVEPRHAEYYKKFIANAALVLMPEAGHAPHWHNPAYVRALILEDSDV